MKSSLALGRRRTSTTTFPGLTHESHQCVGIERYRLATLFAFDQQLAQLFEFHLLFLQQAQPGLYDRLGRTELTALDLAIDEASERFVQGDVHGLVHDGSRIG